MRMPPWFYVLTYVSFVVALAAAGYTGHWLSILWWFIAAGWFTVWTLTNQKLRHARDEIERLKRPRGFFTVGPPHLLVMDKQFIDTSQPAFAAESWRLMPEAHSLHLEATVTDEGREFFESLADAPTIERESEPGENNLEAMYENYVDQVNNMPWLGEPTGGPDAEEGD